MKKRILILVTTGILLIACLTLFMIKKYQTNPVDVTLYHIDQATPQNLDAPFLQTDGEQIFFIDQQQKGRIYSMSVHGDQPKQLTTDSAVQLLLDENMIYYTVLDRDNGIYRMDKKGKQLKKLVDSSFSDLIGIQNNQLYYVDSDENYALKKLDLRQLKIETLSTNWIGPAKLHNNKLYYVDHTDQWGLYEMDLDGGSPKKIVNEDVFDFFFSSQGIVTQNEKGNVFLQKKSSNSSSVLLAERVVRLHVFEDQLIYNRDDGKLYRQSIRNGQGENSQPLIDPDPPIFGDFFIVSNWLYYYDSMNMKNARLHRVALPETSN
ncbi:DUF5050 domain-containing protein [Saccharibacillus sp. JS10]|uniref:DUF5050 domain-containing protein n=1 Tax=Saccharibacillus sp. JS10 TaxID=2950552 RepID=UPI00210E5DB4|nr:DUF5050 domain-containing protein [Saccharibacillus sp. JS10]MCQ4087360.1 DUF5050 domain-containing protein [Saccharibacillus sp. JS10]